MSSCRIGLAVSPDAADAIGVAFFAISPGSISRRALAPTFSAGISSRLLDSISASGRRASAGTLSIPDGASISDRCILRLQYLSESLAAAAAFDAVFCHILLEASLIIFLLARPSDGPSRARHVCSCTHC